MEASPGFLVVWEFFVRSGHERRFEKIYGPAGDWARLFTQDPNYVRTELQRDLRQRGRYLTLDFWTNEGAYDDFLARHQAEYKALDQECEGLTEKERAVGRFSAVG